MRRTLIGWLALFTCTAAGEPAAADELTWLGGLIGQVDMEATSPGRGPAPKQLIFAACQASSANVAHFVDRFRYCAHSTYRIDYLDAAGRSVGTLTSRYTVLGTARNGSRDVVVKFRLDRIFATGKLTLPTATISTSIGCSSCRLLSSTVTRRIATWRKKPDATFRLTGQQGTAPDFVRRADLRMQFQASANDGMAPPSGLASEPLTEFTCDREPDEDSDEGCVFSAFVPTLIFRLSDRRFPAVARHIRTALRSPQSTEPQLPGKDIPSLLTKAPDKRRKFIARQCLNIDERYVSKGMQCDEYPFSSTEERGSPTNPNLSVKPVPREQNASQGGHVRGFYAKNRVTNGQRFAVVVLK